MTIVGDGGFHGFGQIGLVTPLRGCACVRDIFRNRQAARFEPDNPRGAGCFGCTKRLRCDTEPAAQLSEVARSHHLRSDGELTSAGLSRWTALRRHCHTEVDVPGYDR